MADSPCAQSRRASRVIRPVARGLLLLLFVQIPPITTRVDAQNVGGEPGAAIPESGSLSLANALAAVARDPSTGVLVSSLPIETPAARGVPQPGLGLTYNSAAGIREAGVGWGLSVPSIERQSREGLPDYDDPLGHPHADRFVFNGSPIVPICRVEVMGISQCKDSAGRVVKAQPLPGWTHGWTYFRLETDTSRARFFWSSDGLTWRVQFAGGEILELGVPLTRPDLVAGLADDAVDYEVMRTGSKPVVRHALRWNAVRRFDRHLQFEFPANLIAYRWVRLGDLGRGYLVDIWDTPPAGTQARLVPDDFAHHVRLRWVRPPFLRGLAMPRARTTPDLLLIGIDVTSQPLARRTRQLLRRYHLGYLMEGNRHYLTKYETEGRCAPIDELANGALPDTQCRRLPPTRLRYSPRERATMTGRIHLTSVPPHGQGKPIPVTVLDVNGDSLPDFIETKDTDGPHGPRQEQRFYLNNPSGYFPPPVIISDFFPDLFSRRGQTVTGSMSVLKTGSAVLKTGSAAALWYAPGFFGHIVSAAQVATSWRWVDLGRVDPLVDLRSELARAIGDVDGDGLADGLFFRDASEGGPSSPQNGFATVVSMGRFVEVAKPDVGFGSPHKTTSCLGPSPRAVTAMDWGREAAAAAFVDMNGDSFGDLAFVVRDQKVDGRVFLKVQYWPGDGRGNFTACTTEVCQCTKDGFETPSIAFPSFQIPPEVAAQISPDEVALADVNGDGFADLIVAAVDAVTIYWNADGRFWGSLTEPPLSFSPSQLSPTWRENWPPRIQFADMNGNGLTDVVFIVGEDIAFLDVHNFSARYGPSTPAAYAPRPGLLIGIDNGLGASTDVQYISTTDLTRSVGRKLPWTTPQPMPVVKAVSVTSGLPGDERQTITYDYHDPVYDGAERRFRGFRRVSATHAAGTATVRVDDRYFIEPDSIWRTPLLVSSEISDAHDLYHSTKVFSYRVQEVIPGLVTAHAVYPERVDTLVYDTSAWSPKGDTTPVTVTHENSKLFWTDLIPVRSEHHARIRMEQRLDEVGNVVSHVEHGQVKDAAGTRLDDPIARTVVMNPPRSDWRFLPKSVTVAPFGGALDLPRQRRFEYDDLGQLTKVFATLTGTLPLDRFHENPRQPVAPAPPSASHDGEVLLATTEYDVFGNVTLVEGPNDHCATTEFDLDYASLARRNVVFSGGCAHNGTERIGKGGLHTVTLWDRGFETATLALGVDGTISRLDVDDFGRVVATYASDPVSGAPAVDASSRVDYQMTAGGPVQRVKVESSEGGGRTHTTWHYVDSLGRSLLTLDQADPSAGDEGQWVASGMPRRAGGLVEALFEPWFYSGDPADHPLVRPTSASTRFDFDQFGRVRSVHALDGTRTQERVYRGLTVDDIDAAGRVTVTTLNGHGRIVRSTVRTPDDDVSTFFIYEVDGEIASVAESHGTHKTSVRRWFQHDSLGRTVLNVEPNTSKTPRFGPISEVRAWRYAYDDAGQLVGTSDARGCGRNIAYDGLGRPVAEDFSPCLSSQEDYSPERAEVRRIYDAPESGQTTDFGVNVSYLKGRLAATRDRGAHTRLGYDARGRVVSVARQIARPPGLSPSPVGDSGYEAHWSRSLRSYDEANRLVEETTGAEVPELLGAGGASAVAIDYTLRGFVRSVGGSYGPLLTGDAHAADGLSTVTQYADAAQTTATYEYDGRRRSARYTVERPTAGPWVTGPGYTPPASEPSTLPRVLLNTAFSYDAAGNPERIRDQRTATEWSAGFAPVTRTLRYDGFDRIARVDYAYIGGPDLQVDPFAAERTNGRSPVPASVAPKRVGWQTFEYDWLGNPTTTGDDTSLFYDRSLGVITHGTIDIGPHQVRDAGPNLSATHDDAGHLTDVVLQRSGPCTDAAGCNQRFHYDWDEVGHLARARRWDVSDLGKSTGKRLPSGEPAADVRYLYDDSGARVLKTSRAAAGDPHYTAEIFPSLRLERADWDEVAERYTRTPSTEVVYLAGLARVIHGPALPSATDSPQHVFLLLPDHLGSTAAVIDRGTGELVERTSQQAYGSPESDYRPERWAAFRETYQFTGKEDDFDIGLTYFGARYYHAALGRFASADPLTIHAMGAGANPYAYVSGSPLARIDPDGLDGWCIGAAECSQGGPPPVGIEPGAGDSSGGASGASGGGSSSSAPTWVASPKPPSADGVLTTGLKWAARALIAQNQHGHTTLGALRSDPARDGKAGAKQLQAALLGPIGRLTNMLVVPVVVGAIDGKGIAIDGGELASIALDTVLGLLTRGRGRGAIVGAEARGAAGAAARVGAASGGRAAGSLKLVNKIAGDVNCVSCSIVTEAKFRGNPASAVGAQFSSHDLLDPFLGFRGRAFIPANGYRGIRTILNDWGVGSRGIIVGTRIGKPGHAFNVINKRGTIIFLDGQVGGTAVLEIFESLYLLRTW